ncbi:MAG TPA: 30S ribosomal protein S4 [Candidatus Thermoplasmatota archaeon]|nr:30S ribosomal protein S4 [Candidatus Thermoplasmatota archaeon]
MGDPKFSRKKYDTPSHPWQAARIKEEKEIAKKYGLKNKTEVWKALSVLRSIRGQARDLQGKQALNDPQVNLETKNLLSRLNRLGILEGDAGLDDVLALNVEAVLTRRLQTQAYLKGLAATPDQARQLIVHGHVAVNGGRVRVPGYLVTRAEEAMITYAAGSVLENDQHPVRPKLITVPGGDGSTAFTTVDEKQKATGTGPRPPQQGFGGRGGGGRGRGGPSGRGRGGGSKPRGGRRIQPSGGGSEGGA